MHFFKLVVFPLFCLVAPLSVMAHPHSFVDLKNKVLVDGTQLKGFQMEWTMDEIASAELIYEVKNNPDHQAAKKSITAEMEQTAIENHYFSYLYNAKDQPLKFSVKPSNTTFRIAGNRVVFYITFYLSKPYDLKNNAIRFYTYEPSYYMAMEYNNQQDLSINSSECKAKLTQPNVNNSLRLYASSLDKNQKPNMPDGEDNSLGAQFAQTVEVVCE
ncbi:ABC transporter substrate-binding protein [[Haemophilus] ducreyi]|uniref:ABC-type transport system, periplasmic component n=2 Tax=Haemophilus ducreyi TaxID=730 RepID=Q7VL60_HAEDU|nr:DUF1007 family protein [[Haemophilus] ducreyi]AAP96399.1 hypothetical protein HD_1622 [[Haemophilus] ducreyi 35000HP]AKO31280.1 ABC transporter substrate-binding protein [[Haemophilus] ducreyi]AKO32727.1 ABC transporter substrate-binding protein [[Haemophilus] ducreyi]AKO34176.1 ABC transporter substrate-binding protein [[Haemophilus] ducreyi]AKO37080.1 ABC transporter substrate-binding protein [[Haemophilus] ducreyi]